MWGRGEPTVYRLPHHFLLQQVSHFHFSLTTLFSSSANTFFFCQHIPFFLITFFTTIIFTFSDHLFSFCTITQFSLISVFLSLCLLFSLFREHQKLHWKKHKSSCCAYKVSLVKVFVTKAVLCMDSTRFAVHQTSAATWWPPET